MFWYIYSTFITVTILTLSYFRWILPESPRWLLALGKTQEVHTILEKAARFNNRKLPKNFDKLLQQEVIEEECGENVNVLDLFRTSQMRKKTLCLFLIWFGVYLVYYGVVLNLANIGGNLYINSVSEICFIYEAYS